MTGWGQALLSWIRHNRELSMKDVSLWFLVVHRARASPVPQNLPDWSHLRLLCSFWARNNVKRFQVYIPVTARASWGFLGADPIEFSANNPGQSYSH